MAKLLCAKSSILFQCEHMPISLSQREVSHPIFYTPKKKLLGLASDWANRKLSPTESYLVFLALLDSTDLLVWRTSVKYNDYTQSRIQLNMESLLRVIGKIDIIKHPSFSLPSFAISPDTCDLSNIQHWIAAWESSIKDWQSGYKFAETERRIEIRETALEKLIKSPYTKPDKLSSILADWFEDVADVPPASRTHPLTRTRIELVEYWKQIIRACVDEDKIWRFPEKDIKELIIYCEDEIEHGSIHAASLMKTLKKGYSLNSDQMGFGSLEVGAGTSFSILQDPEGESEVMTLNLNHIISSAPIKEPLKHEFPSYFKFLQAKAKWELAQARVRKMAPQNLGESA